MRKIRILVLVLAALMLFSLCTAALASGEASDGASGEASDEISAEASGEISGEASDETSGEASPEPVYVVSDDGLAVDDSLASVELAPNAVVSETEISGVRVSSTENAAGGLKFSASDGYLKVGGEEDSFDVTTYFTGEELSFNTVIDLREADGYVWGTDSSGGSAVAAKGSGEMEIENVYARNTGIGRYTVNLNSGTTIIKNSYFESVGTFGEYSSMPWFTSQYGNSRCLIACGTLNAYIYNSMAASEGFGSWSTDAGGDPYSFYLYNGDALNRYGGYGTYADVNLTVHIYGSRFDSAEFGAFVSNSGILYLGSSADALEAEDEVFLENLVGQELAEDTPTEIIADQNAVSFHVVDLMTAADPDTGLMDSAVSEEWRTTPILNAKNSILTTEGASWSMEIDFPAAQQAWLDHIKGAAIVFRGCSGVANLENVELGSSSGVIIMSCLDLDSSAVQILDDIATEDIPGCQVNSVDNAWTGDIVNEDYQHPMRLDFVNTELTGAILTYDIDHWNDLFADYSDVSYVLDEETGRYVNADDPSETGPNYTARDPGQIYGMLCGLTEYDAVRGTYLSMDADSVWNVTAVSNLNSLTVEAGAVINGEVTVDGGTVDVSAGGSWTGDIVVTPLQASASGEASASEG